MTINNISPEIQENFKKENWMSFEEAVNHVKNWIKEKNLPTAESGIMEIEKFCPELDELIELKSELRKAKSAEFQANAKNLWINTSKSNENIEAGNFSDDEKLIAAMSYIWFLAIVPLVLKRESLLCQYHWKQWLILAIFFFFMITISNFIPLWWIMNSFISILQVVIAIYWWWQAYSGKLWTVPWIWDFMKKLKI